MDKTKEALLLFGGLVLAVAALGVIFVPTSSVPQVDFEILAVVGIVLLAIGALIA